MKKEPLNRKTSAAADSKRDGLAPLIAEVRELIVSARNAAASTVNTLQVMTNFEIGRRIVEHEQKGEKRAEYGVKLLEALSAQLTEEFGRGFSVTNLKLMRQLFVGFRTRIGQQAIDQFRIGKDTFLIYCKTTASLYLKTKTRDDCRGLNDHGFSGRFSYRSNLTTAI